MEQELFDRQKYEAQPVLDALRACAAGEFKSWTPEQLYCLIECIGKYPHAAGTAASMFLCEHVANCRDWLRQVEEVERNLTSPFH